MMKQGQQQRRLSGLLAVVAGAAVALSQAAWAGSGVSYQVVPAKAVSDSGAVDVTLLVEQPSGRTWVLDRRSGTLTWQPLSYSEGQGLTTGTLPPPSPYASVE